MELVEFDFNLEEVILFVEKILMLEVLGIYIFFVIVEDFVFYVFEDILID